MLQYDAEKGIPNDYFVFFLSLLHHTIFHFVTGVCGRFKFLEQINGSCARVPA